MKMTTLLDQASHLLLASTEIQCNQLEQILGKTLTAGIDRAEIFLQRTEYESWALEDGIVSDADYSINQGFGLRAISGERVGFAYADTITLPELTKAAESARSIVQTGHSGQ